MPLLVYNFSVFARADVTNSEENMDISRFYTTDEHCTRTTLGNLF